MWKFSAAMIKCIQNFEVFLPDFCIFCEYLSIKTVIIYAMFVNLVDNEKMEPSRKLFRGVFKFRGTYFSKFWNWFSASCPRNSIAFGILLWWKYHGILLQYLAHIDQDKNITLKCIYGYISVLSHICNYSCANLRKHLYLHK